MLFNDKSGVITGGLNIVVLSNSTFTETMGWLEQELSKAKISQKEILTAQLLLEETFLRLSKGAGDPADFSVTVTVVLAISACVWNPLGSSTILWWK